MQALADGILPRPEAARQRLVDDGNRRRGTVVAICEVPSGRDGNLERLEVSRAYRVHVDHRDDGLPPRDGFSIAVPHHDANPIRERYRHDVEDARRDDARRCFETFDQLANERLAAPLGVAACLEIERRGLHVRGFETELHGLRVAEALDEKSRRDQQEDRHRYLCHEEGRAQPAVPPPVLRTLQRAHEIHARDRQRRHDAERQSRRNRDDSRKRQNAEVNREISAIGTGTGTRIDMARRVNQNATAKPRRAPAPERSRYSVSSWRIKRTRAAPRDWRIASSVLRPAARASTRLATLTHTMSNTRVAAAIRMPVNTDTGGAISGWRIVPA